MNLSDLRTEVHERGFDYLATSRVDYFINRAYQLICDRYDWPFLKTTTTGTAPLTISDLGKLQFVVDTTQEQSLHKADERGVREMDPALTSTGSPIYYYLVDTSLRVWPVNTSDTLTVSYVRVPDDLATETDEPVFPSRFHYLIADGAVLLAYADSDEFDNETSGLVMHERNVQAMAKTLLDPDHFNPPSIEQARWLGDYGA